MATRPEIEEKLPEEEKGEHEYNKDLEDVDVDDLDLEGQTSDLPLGEAGKKVWKHKAR